MKRHDKDFYQLSGDLRDNEDAFQAALVGLFEEGEAPVEQEELP